MRKRERVNARRSRVKEESESFKCNAVSARTMGLGQHTHTRSQRPMLILRAREEKTIESQVKNLSTAARLWYIIKKSIFKLLLLIIE